MSSVPSNHSTNNSTSCATNRCWENIVGEEIFKLILVDLGVCIAVGILFDVLIAVFVRTRTCCCKVRYVLLLVIQRYVCKNGAAIGRACSICRFLSSPLQEG